MKPAMLSEKGLRELGAKLKTYREESGWSQRAAADYVSERVEPGISASALGEIEKAHGVVKMETLLMLASIGYGNMTFTEMVDIATERRLAMCEKDGSYNVDKKDTIAV